jgi:hypothetical protein
VTSPSLGTWESLQEAGAVVRGEFRVTSAGVRLPEGDVLFAIDQHEFRHLLIPIKSVALVDSDERSSGVHLTGRTLVDNTGESRFADLACRKPHLADLFNYLVAEVLENLRARPSLPVAAARNALNRWRELLERNRGDILSMDALVGLLGELWILTRLVREHGTDSIRMWTGPNGTRFDFQHGKVCLEVKTTTALQSRVVHIHGIDQLQIPNDSELALAVVTAERLNDSGVSVPELVGELRNLGVDRFELTEKLMSAGYSDHDAGVYSLERFSVREEKYFHVNSQFPRIVRESFRTGDLPAGVRDLRYSVDLTSPPPDTLGPEAVSRLLDALARSSDAGERDPNSNFLG